MKGKMCILLLAMTLAATVAFAAGQEDTTKGAATTEGPVYGGKVTWLANWIQIEAETVGINFDMANRNAIRCFHASYIEPLARGNIEKWGPRGTGEWPFKAPNKVPDKYMDGGLAESFELFGDKQVLYLRKGVMWTGNDRIGMAPREFTAYDAEYSVKRILNHPQCWVYGQPWYDVENIKAVDKYTIEFPYKNYNSGVFGWHAVFFAVQPEEVVKAGASDWRNQTGTGPFILTDYVEDAYLAYERNPTYWDKTTIDGKVYDIPFIDEMVMPIITDESTQIAAIRTAELDYVGRVYGKYKESLQKTSPGLLMDPYVFDNSIKIYLDCSDPPFDKKEVRRAIMIGTDLNTIGKAVYGDYSLYSFPASEISAGCTPPEKRPASANELYEYNPTKAKQMLAAAGYPSGFEIKLSLPSGEIDMEDMGAMLVEMWGKLGVKVNLNPVETAALHKSVGDYSYGDAYLSGYGGDVNEMGHVGRMTSTAENPSRVNDPYLEEMFPKVSAIVDYDERIAKAKEVNLYALEQVYQIGMPAANGFHVWWPWLQNYYGELDAAHLNPNPMIARIWVDEGMKAKMGF
jgi:peptide/nickel transport system substrate-binding protein